MENRPKALKIKEMFSTANVDNFLLFHREIFSRKSPKVIHSKFSTINTAC